MFRRAPAPICRSEARTDAKSRRSRSLNADSKDFVVGRVLSPNTLVKVGWSKANAAWIADVLVAVSSTWIVLAATFVLLNGISAYSDADASEPTHREVFSAAVNAWIPPTGSWSAVALLQLDLPNDMTPAILH